MSVLNRVKEKRLSTRVLLSVPVAVEPLSGPGQDRPPPQPCNSVDVSDRGIGLECPSPIGLTDCILSLKISENSGISLPGRLCWSARDPKTNAHRYGFSFVAEDGPEKTKLRQHLADLLLDRSRIVGRKVPTTIQSDLVSFSNRRGERTVGFYDRPAGELYKPGTPFVVIPPAYGEHKTAALLPAYTFAANGFHVLRYDTTGSVGESDGSILDFTLSQHEEDLHAALDYVENSFQAYPIVVCAASLGARSALKAATCDPRIRALALLVPVVDLQTTLTAVHLEDLVDRHLRGQDYGTMNVLGHSVRADHFLGNSIAFNFHNLQTTIEDSRSIRVPIHVIAGLRDAWVSLDTVKLALESTSSQCKTLYLLDQSMHRLEENPKDLSAAFQHLVEQVRQNLLPTVPLAFHSPSLREVVTQRRIEKDRMRLHMHKRAEDEKEFWRSYLSDFTLIRQVEDYQQLASDVVEMIGPPAGPTILLDAGCGSGNLAFFFLSGRCPLSLYIGIDFVHDALLSAMKTIKTLEPKRILGGESASGSYTFIQGNLDTPLPLLSGTVDQIVCNLVLSYLNDPLGLLREFVRVLKPEGRMVISTLKPMADCSQIYRNVAEKARSREQVDQARTLLNNAGGIAVKETHGLYRFFSQLELEALLEASGAVPLSWRISLGNQAILIAAVKA